MNRYPNLMSVISVAIQAVYNNDIDTITTLARIIPRGIDWNRVATHVNENTNERTIDILSYILEILLLFLIYILILVYLIHLI